MSRKRKRKSNFSKNIALSICFILIGIGILLASRSSDGNILSSGFPSWEPDGSVLNHIRDSIKTPAHNPDHHFPALETIVVPDSVPQQIKEYIGFTISFNKENHTPNYVAWELLGEESKGKTNVTENSGRIMILKDVPTQEITQDLDMTEGICVRRATRNGVRKRWTTAS